MKITSFRNAVIRRVLFPVADRLRGRRMSSVLGELEDSQWWPRQRLLDFQNQRVAALVQHAWDHVPYYRDLMAARGLTPADVRTRADLPRLPLLFRENLRANYPDRSLAQGVSRKGWHVGKTGGSTTGEPLVFTFDRGSLDYGRAVYYRGIGWAHGEPGSPMLELWGQPVGKLGLVKAAKEKAIDVCFGVYRMNAFRITDELLQRCVALLTAGRVRFVYAYVSALQELCRYMQGRGLRARGVAGIMTTAEVLLPETRQLLETTLGGHVFDGYGCGEINGIAYDCERRDGLHIGMERALIEVIGPDGQPVAPGTPGRLAITDLHNYAMPLIRYVNGDEGLVDPAPCACGRGLDRLKQLLGRTCDIVDGVNGQHVHSYFFASLFGSLGWTQSLALKQFQIVQESATDLRVRLVLPTPPAPTEEQRLRDRLLDYLGPMNFQIEYCQHIDATGNGKFRWTINRTRTRANK